MSFDKDIGAPFTLASLPKPGESTNGRTQAAGVCSLSRSKKRKRTEVAVAVDGEGILIYDLQNPHLTTSYGVSPQTSFSSPPYSVYRKGNAKRPAVRFTYAAVNQSVVGGKPQLICYTEQTLAGATSETTTSTYALPDDADGVVSVEFLPNAVTAKGSFHDVLLVLRNGDVTCLSSDLKNTHWSSSLSSPGSHVSFHTIEHVTLTTAKSALRGLLQGRHDIAAILDPQFDKSPELLELTQILCIVGRQTDEHKTLSLLQVPLRSADIISMQQAPLKHLVTWPFPNTKQQQGSASAKAVYSVHASSGVIHELRAGNIISYDFTGTTSKIASELHVSNTEFQSFIRLSPDLLFAVSPSLYGVYDVKYKSAQALRSTSPDAERKSSKKRKVEAPELAEGSYGKSLCLTTYFTETGLVVGLSGHEIVGIQLAESQSRKKVKAPGSLLIDSIGKGIPAKSSKVETVHTPSDPLTACIPGDFHKKNALWRGWEHKKHTLNKLVSEGEIAKFESTFAEELNVELANADAGPENKEPQLLTNGMHETDSDARIRAWRLPKTIPDFQRHLYRPKAMYALSKIFRWRRDVPPAEVSDASSVRVDFFAPNLLQWLLLAGFLTKESIQQALRGSKGSVSKGYTVKDGDLVKALVEFDPDLLILSAVLNHTQFLPIGEVLHAIKALLLSLSDQPSQEEAPALLANGTTPSEDDMDVDFQSQLDAADHDLKHAMQMLDDGLLTRSHALRPALIRLHAFPAPVVSTTLRRVLTRSELEFLIRLLHLELRNGGWTSPYDQEEAPTEEDPDDHAVAIIASLLGCALDAIGTNAWLTRHNSGSSTIDVSVESLIASLQEETTLALHGNWEARFVNGLLGEFVRFANKASKSRKPNEEKLLDQTNPVAIDFATDIESAMLPMGGQMDLGVEQTKTKGGKKQEISKREMGMLISKKVPKYSFERIVI